MQKSKITIIYVKNNQFIKTLNNHKKTITNTNLTNQSNIKKDIKK